MAYGTVKVDNITFTDGGIDQTVTVSGIVHSTSGNITATGTIQGQTIIGTSTVYGSIVSGDVAAFTTATAATGIFTSQISGATITGNVGSFTTITGGTVTLTSGVFASGTAAAPSVSIGTTDNGLYSPGTDQVAVATNGQGRLFVDASGNVSINTASTIAPGGFGYAREFALTGATSGDSSISVNLRGSRTVPGGFADINFWHQSTANRAYIQARRGSSDSAIDLDFITSGGAGMRITSAGLVGIGTSAPQQLLHVHNTSAADARLKISNGTTGSTQFDGLEFNCASTGLAGIIQWEQQPLYFYTNNGSAVDPRLAITAAGLVGIGTSSPGATLSVFSAASAGTPAIQVASSGSLANNDIVRFQINGLTNGFRMFQDASSNVRYSFEGGSVGIGTTSPRDLLHISGTGDIKAEIETTSTGVGANAGIEFTTGDGTNFVIQAGNAVSGGIRVYDVQNNSERLRIDSSGRLGIGTPTCGAPLSFADTNALKIQFNSNVTNYYGISKLAGGGSLGDGEFKFVAGDVTAGTFTFSSAKSEKVRITNTGYMRMASGTGGIQFNGDTAAANALDDYEDGTFAPTIEGSTAAGSGTYANRVGTYTKIGNSVFFRVYVIWSGHTGTGDLELSGLPFVSNSTSGRFSAVNIGSVFEVALTANHVLLGGYIPTNSSRVIFVQGPVGGGVASSVPFDAAGNLIFSGHYTV